MAEVTAFVNVFLEFNGKKKGKKACKGGDGGT